MTDTRPARELRQRIADYRGLRAMTMDKQALEDIARVIGETEARLRLRASNSRRRGHRTGRNNLLLTFKWPSANPAAESPPSSPLAATCARLRVPRAWSQATAEGARDGGPKLVTGRLRFSHSCSMSCRIRHNIGDSVRNKLGS